MSRPSLNTSQLQGFIALDYKNAVSKVAEFVSAGLSQMHVVFDWDRTSTANGGGRDITSWGVVQNLLPIDGRKIDQALYDEYHPKELTQTLTEEEARFWWRASLELHVKYGTDIRKMKRAVCDVGMRPRDGVIELFHRCEALNVPTIILSAGVRNVIEWVTENYGIRPTATLATNLLTDGSGKVTGWDESTVIHNLNKHEMGHNEISLIRRDRPYTILLGDSVDDARMVKGEKDVLRIRVYDNKPALSAAQMEQYIQESLAAGYDLIVENTLSPVVNLLNWIAAGDFHHQD
jgi:phosphoserine phosphatase